jgi:hypothetical protein
MARPQVGALAGDMKAFAAMGEKGMLEIVAATHSGMTTVDFNKSLKQWLETAKHPRSKLRPGPLEERFSSSFGEARYLSHCFRGPE